MRRADGDRLLSAMRTDVRLRECVREYVPVTPGRGRRLTLSHCSYIDEPLFERALRELHLKKILNDNLSALERVAVMLLIGSAFIDDDLELFDERPE